MKIVKKYDLNELELWYQKLFDFNENIKDFEQWVYSSEYLKEILNDDDYFDLISVNFNSKYARIDVDNILKKYVRLNYIEISYLFYVLEQALLFDDRYCEYLGKIYDYYCDGYDFLREVAIVDGLNASAPHQFGYRLYENLTDEEKRKLRAIYDNSHIKTIKKFIKWINDGEIVFTENSDRFNKYYRVGDKNSI